jgi:hypothetical protein
MSIETAFEHLQRRLGELKEEFGELRVNAEEFFPVGRTGRRKNGHSTQEAPPPVTTLADQAADLEGEIEEALQAARKAAKAVRQPRNLVEAQLATVSVHRALNKTLRQFLDGVAAYGPLNQLHQMGRELGNGWPKWTELIATLISTCREHLLETAQALGECWQELAEKLAANSVSLQTTNIGQQISAREPVPSGVQEFT